MPRPTMPEGLYVSVSQVKCFLRCPRQFELKYVRGVTPAFLPVALAFGSAFHEALAAWYSELKLTREPLRRDHLLDVFRDAWERASTGPVPLQVSDDEEEPGAPSIVDRGVSMLHAFAEHATPRIPHEDVEHVEHGFAVHIHEADTGAVLEEQLVGTMDLVIVENGVRLIVEHKSSSKRFTVDQLRYDLQCTAYGLAAREAGMGEVGLRFQVVTKTRMPAVQLADVHRDAQDEDDFLRTAGGVLRAIDAGVSFPLRGWQCRSCPYVYACTSRSGSVACAA